jgi:hypothetical protein
MYEDMGWQAKQQMITLVAWLTPFVFGLIAFSVNSYCKASPTISLASVTALAMSAFMAFMIWAALRRADEIYKNADEVIEGAKRLLPPTIYYIMSHKGEKKSDTVLLLRLGLRRIGWVYISFVYAAFIPVVGSFVLWRRPTELLAKFCGVA